MMDTGERFISSMSPFLKVRVIASLDLIVTESSVWLTRAATFVDKAKIFPGATFVVGADTAMRLGVAEYYVNAAARDAAIATLVSLGCRFLVFGRLIEDRFLAGDRISLPPDVADLCQFVPESDFRLDVSSSEIRQRRDSSAG